MARLSLPVLLAVVLSARGGCRWRFDSCARQQESWRCSIRMRQWCDCDGGTTSCPGNATIAVNATGARFLLYGRSWGSLERVCDFPRCSLVPGPCEWGAWKVFFKTECMIAQDERSRVHCCHPTFPKVRLEACRSGKRRRQTRQRTRTYEECYGKTVKTYDAPRPTDKLEEVSERWDFGNAIIYTSGSLLLLVAIGVSCWLGKSRNQRRQAQPDQPRPQVHNRRMPNPKRIIIPQPGQPLPPDRVESVLMPD